MDRIEQETFQLFCTDLTLACGLQTWESPWNVGKGVPEAPLCQLSPWDWDGSAQLFVEEQLPRV